MHSGSPAWPWERRLRAPSLPPDTGELALQLERKGRALGTRGPGSVARGTAPPQQAPPPEARGASALLPGDRGAAGESAEAPARGGLGGGRSPRRLHLGARCRLCWRGPRAAAQLHPGNCEQVTTLGVGGKDRTGQHRAECEGPGSLPGLCRGRRARASSVSSGLFLQRPSGDRSALRGLHSASRPLTPGRADLPGAYLAEPC
ncbi:uncharacterized protein LOC119058354 [Artibeus jamaicensis]|uniref:uncharacterized protein LOC119058354 n=1 Tax=Artibeus jamaicensis TaxID=9417 RepID=UPI00235AB51C|nr:uncharacterized protein LOC119058354 [Artibeus jamaicensis]